MSFKLIPQTSYFTIASFCIVKGTDAIVFGEDGSVSETPVFDETVIYPTPKVLPESGVHPRVYFKKEDIPQIKKNMELEENATALDLHRRNLAKRHRRRLPAASGATNYTAAPLGVIESYVFEYAMNGTKEYGQKAVDAMCNYVTQQCLTRQMAMRTTIGARWSTRLASSTIGAMTCLRTT